MTRGTGFGRSSAGNATPQDRFWFAPESIKGRTIRMLHTAGAAL